MTPFQHLQHTVATVGRYSEAALLIITILSLGLALYAGAMVVISRAKCEERARRLARKGQVTKVGGAI